ncbi:4-hydroxy-tetrahydrodipicolinate synthase [Arachnia propionica]|uniref:4-hydroxy-tetrahydrodipicolinate synthase n=1 Tax=Arachnia propionica TaxID=1750 RepID=A0A3P1T8J4_9ACTN|nr:4-hydroxy-tetrahydrodipicolinate synthase [Arachnia propionica]MDO5082254.1 4-hydroxy-tetrahydrodipicolinate synthase [Arachnia propionica]RRD05807.1 4-hydroxy-tetrahydrodipicolinate synthase [Arachnia propionica]
MSNNQPEPIFGRLLTAMITPFGSNGELDLGEAVRLATHLVDELGHDGLVINGTTGESPTTSDAEKRALLEAVIEAVGDRASVVAGVGTFDTHHTVRLAEQAAEAGADGLLVVTPYYSRPPVDALEAHFLTVADQIELPVMLYDIPHRAGIPIPEESLIRLADHPRIVAVKDAKGDIASSSVVLARTTLTYYAGDDAYLLPLLAVGGAGVVGTSTHFTGAQTRGVIEAFLAGDVDRARQLNAEVLAAFRGVFATQGAMMVKAALNRRGFAVGECRPPMGRVAPEVLERFLDVLDQTV